MSSDRLVAPVIFSALMLALATCGGGGEKQALDDTAREISNEELGRMVLALEQFPPEYAAFKADEDNGLLTIDKEVEGTFDPAKERSDLEKFGWISACKATFSDPQFSERQTGVSLVESEVEAFRSVD